MLKNKRNMLLSILFILFVGCTSSNENNYIHQLNENSILYEIIREVIYSSEINPNKQYVCVELIQRNFDAYSSTITVECRRNLTFYPNDFLKVDGILVGVITNFYSLLDQEYLKEKFLYVLKEEGISGCEKAYDSFDDGGMWVLEVKGDSVFRFIKPIESQ
jgi:hypothetical protein